MAGRVVIVGAGISGLSLAYALRGRGVDVTVLEAAAKPGGNLRTRFRGGFVMDEGADSWVAQKPQATELARRLGLGERLIETQPANRRVYLATEDGLLPLPDGLVLGIPTKLRAITRTPLLSMAGKARLLLDLFLPAFSGRLREHREDEPLARFLTRRLGAEAAQTLTGPLLGGLYTGDASSLSLRATFPQLARLEETHGSLIRGARSQRAHPSGQGRTSTLAPTGGRSITLAPTGGRSVTLAPTSGRSVTLAPSGGRSITLAPTDDPSMAPTSGRPAAPPSAFVSLRGGLRELIEGLSRALGDVIRYETRAQQLRRTDQGWTIEHTHGSLTAPNLVLTGPAHAAADLVRAVAPELASSLAAIPYASSRVVFLGFRQSEVPHPLDGTGYLIARSKDAADRPRRGLASTWVSSKWIDRAPAGYALLRVFFPGPDPNRPEDDTDRGLVDRARTELAQTLGIVAQPCLTHVARFDRASPQPELGHLVRVQRIEEHCRALGGLYLLGSAYHGVGISDCVREAEQLAERLSA